MNIGRPGTKELGGGAGLGGGGAAGGGQRPVPPVPISVVIHT